jgi:hypothetical protein
MQKFLFFTLFLLLVCQLQAQTITWTNAGGTLEWTDAANWDTGEVPAAGDDVLIEDDDVTLTGTTTIQRVQVGSGATLTIAAASVLNIDGFAGDDDGLETTPSADIFNNGTINISNLSGGAADGVYVRKTFINAGTLNITGVGHHGISLAAGAMTNTGTINISAVGLDDNESDYISVDDSGSVPSTFDNNGSITITVTTADHGIYVNDASTFNNSSMISISATGASEGDDGIQVNDRGVFNNLAGGTISINDAKDFSVYVAADCSFTNSNGATLDITGGIDGNISLDEDGVFNNSGSISILNTLRWGVYVTDESVFTNTSTGIIAIDGAGDYSLYIDANNRATPATLINQGTITVDNGSASGTRTVDSGVFENMASGTLTITNPGADGLETQSGSSFNNAGTVSISGSGDGIEMEGNSSLTNTGAITITSATRDGVEMKGTSIMNNSGTIDIDSPAADGFELEGDPTFNNMMGGVLTVTNPASDKDGLQIDGAGAAVNNDGRLLFIGNGSDDIELKAGSFVNTANAVFEPGASPGMLEVRGADIDFGSSTINFEITGLTATTEYDQISKSDPTNVTISNTNAYLDWGSYVPAIGDEFTIIRGSGTVTGEFASVTSSNPDIVYDVNYFSTGTGVRIEVIANLPVTLTSFQGELLPKGTSMLKWETASEADNDYFDLEYSTDGENFSLLTRVAGNGNTTDANQYSYEHNNLQSEMNYYRLKQVDYDGRFTHSSIIMLQMEVDANSSQVYPNPANNVVVYSGAEATLTVFDAYGKYVREIQTGSGTQTIDVSNLRPGAYLMEIVRANGTREVKRFVKQ